MVSQPLALLVRYQLGGSASLQSTLRSSSVLTTTTAVLSLRGGEVAEVGLDLARATFRLDSINTYSIVTALLLQATLRLYADTPKDLEEECSRHQKVAKLIFIFSAGVSIICGAYTTVVFSLLGLYSKSALGMGLDASFLEFYAATAAVRKRAFDSFLVALLSFEVCFTSSLLLNYDGKVRWWSTGIATVVAIWSWMHWRSIMTLAGTLLFKQ